MRNKIIYLVGFMASGKTLLGKKMANALSYSRIDLDHYIELKTNLPIKNIFSFWGEEKFRIIESDCLREISKNTPLVVSCGGGTPCFHSNMDFMNKNGITIFINVPKKHIVQRLIKNSKKRPLTDGKNEQEIIELIDQLYKVRLPIYEQATILYNPLEDDYQELLVSIKATLN